MKCIRRPLTPLDKMFQGPPIAYTPGSLAKKPRGSTPAAETADAEDADAAAAQISIKRDASRLRGD